LIQTTLMKFSIESSSDDIFEIL